jgi:hypothetical protein
VLVDGFFRRFVGILEGSQGEKPEFFGRRRRGDNKKALDFSRA